MLTTTQRHYALAILTITYVFNFLDRQLLAILLEPIKTEFGVSDSAMGLLYGLSFALFYATLAVPVARLADKHSRRDILAIAAGLWSLMTVLCGFATSYIQMLIFRTGVAVGESGGVPPSQSLITDYYPPEQRTRAMAIFSSASFIGTLLAMITGAVIAQNYGWRSAFFIIGAPGIILAFLVRYTLKEPVRGQWDSVTAKAEQPSFLKTLKQVWHLSSMRFTILGCGFAGIAGYGLGFWVPTFMIRIHSVSLIEAGVMIGGLGATAGLVGSIFGGWLCDKLSLTHRKWLLLIPALSLLLSLPIMLLFLYWPSTQFDIAGFSIPSAMLFYCLAGFVGSWWVAPTYVVVQELVAPNQRTLACAILLFVMNFAGFGLGPYLVGLFSDFLTPAYGNESVRYALIIIMSTYLLAIFCYYFASKQFIAQRYT